MLQGLGCKSLHAEPSMEEHVGRRAVLGLQMGHTPHRGTGSDVRPRPWDAAPARSPPGKADSNVPSGETWLHLGQQVAFSQDQDARGLIKALGDVLESTAGPGVPTASLATVQTLETERDSFPVFINVLCYF